MEITEFLLARIAEDAEWVEHPLFPEIVRARMLAECEAKRRTVYYLRAPVSGSIPELSQALRIRERMLQYLALPYADHPDFDPDWKI